MVRLLGFARVSVDSTQLVGAMATGWPGGLTVQVPLRHFLIFVGPEPLGSGPFGFARVIRVAAEMDFAQSEDGEEGVVDGPHLHASQRADW